MERLSMLIFAVCCAVLLCACAEKSPETAAATTAAAVEAATQTEQSAEETPVSEEAAPLSYENLPVVGGVALPDEITQDYEAVPEGIDTERHVTCYSDSKFGLGVMLYKAPTIVGGRALEDYIPYGAPVEVYAKCRPCDNDPLPRVRNGVEYSMNYYWLWCCYEGKWGWCESFELLPTPLEPFYDPLFDEEVTPPEKCFDSCQPASPTLDGLCYPADSWHYSWDEDIPVRNRPDVNAPVKRELQGGTDVWALGTTKPESAWTFIWYIPHDPARCKDPDTGYYGWESINKMYYGWIYMDDEGMLVDHSEYTASHSDLER